MREYKLALLLPTRGRTEALRRSVLSLVNTADDVDSFELLMGFDNDDTATVEYFQQTLQPELDSLGVNYQVHEFERIGYIRLNEYVNKLATSSDADWLVFWNDDAVMESTGWDTTITGYTGQFKLLAFDTHKKHPYSIFPIVPREWLDIFGYMSPHSLSDAWLSQQAYLLDILERIDVKVLHDRFDLTGNNKDETFENRPMLEGNPKDPRDFHHLGWQKKRLEDAKKLSEYMESKGIDTTFYKAIIAGKQDPWEKLKLNDVNKQMSQFDIRKLK